MATRKPSLTENLKNQLNIEKEANCYRVPKELFPYVKKILLRGLHEFKMERKQDGCWFCNIKVTQETFSKILDRAECERKSTKTGMFYVTERENDNIAYLHALLEAAGKTRYEVTERYQPKEPYRVFMDSSLW